MAGHKFEDGAVVRLKSGGPLMTVESFKAYASGDRYMCRWFDAKNTLMGDTFTEAQLERASAGAALA